MGTRTVAARQTTRLVQQTTQLGHPIVVLVKMVSGPLPQITVAQQLIIVLPTAETQARQRPEHGSHDADFAIAAADGGLLEVRLGELAKKQASSQEIKSFANTMTIDHGKANDELKNLASKLSISLPQNLSEKSQQKYDELAQKKGTSFDKAYSEMMVKDHQETIEKFQTEATNGLQPELRDWAGAKIPNLQHHLTMVKKINDSQNETSASQ